MSHSQSTLLIIAVLMVVSACTDPKPPPEKAVFDDYRKFVERENGISCEELGEQVMRFVESDIKPMVIAGREGQDWVAVASSSTVDTILRYEEPVFLCHLVQSNAQRLGYPMRGDFNTLQQLLRALSIHTMGNPPSSKDVSPGAFENIDKLYRNLTFASRPPSGELPPPEAVRAKR